MWGRRLGRLNPPLKMKITIELTIDEQLPDTDKKELVTELIRSVQAVIPSEVKIQISDNSNKK
jgi:hypothetical protein